MSRLWPGESDSPHGGLLDALGKGHRAKRAHGMVRYHRGGVY